MNLYEFNTNNLKAKDITTYLPVEEKEKRLNQGMAICVRKTRSGLYVLDAIAKDVFLNMMYFCVYLDGEVNDAEFTKSDLDYVYRRNLHREIEKIKKSKSELSGRLWSMDEDYARFVKMFNIEVNNEVQARNFAVKNDIRAREAAKAVRQTIGMLMPGTVLENEDVPDTEQPEIPENNPENTEQKKE